MTRNPEFIRNLWLVHSPIKLVILPPLLAGGFLFLYLLAMTGDETLAGHRLWDSAAFGIVFFFLILNGSAGGTFATELQEHTWDGQRMSAIPPWSMAWGKLFGSTAIGWYGGFLCIVFYIFLARSQSLPIAEIVANITVWILAGIIAQSTGMVSALVGLLNAPVTDRAAGGTVPSLLVWALGVSAVPWSWLWLTSVHSVIWFGWQIGALGFLILTAAVFAAWSLIGLYFVMRREFQYTNSPLPWLGFAAFTIFYAAGFEPGAGDPLMVLSQGRWMIDGLIPLYVGALLLYAIALTDHTDWKAVRRIGRACERRDWKEIFDQTPRSVITLALLAVVTCGLIIGGDESSWPMVLGRMRANDETLIAALLFAARDMAMIFLLSSKRPSDSSGFLPLICLLGLHLALPYAVTYFSFTHSLMPLFRPIPTESALLTMGPVLLQVVVITVLLGRRVRAIHLEKL